MTKRQILLASVLLVSSRAAFAQAPCTPGNVIVSVNDAVVRPSFVPATETTLVVNLRNAAGEALTGGQKIQLPAAWTIADIDRVRDAAGGLDRLQMVWSQGGMECVQVVSLPARTQPVIGERPAAAPQGTSAVGTGSLRRGSPAYTERDCGKAGSEWLAQIAKERSELDIRRVTVLVFRGESGLCFQNNERPTQGDPIYVGVFTSEPDLWSGTADFQPCSIEPSAPSILITDRLSVGVVQAKEWYVLDYLPRRCWNPSVAVTVTGTNRRINYTLAQATRYRATLHLGVVFSENHDVTFGLRPESPTVNRVFSQGPLEQGPDYVAALVFYSILRYIPPLGGRPSYPGRDPVRDNGFADKLGAVIGVGLRDPRERFNFGFSYEIAAGVNVLGVWDYAQTNVLAGIAENDVFTGQVEQIPTTKEWRRKFVMGLSLDLVYATAALRR